MLILNACELQIRTSGETVNSLTSNYNQVKQIRNLNYRNMENIKYEEAVAEIEDIVKKMENNQLDIDSMTEKLKRAQSLIKLCKDKLTKTNEEINNILNDNQP